MTFVGANPFVEKTVCVLLSWSLYSLLTCLCRCQGPWGERPDVQWVTQIPCSQRTDHRVKENNPTPPCSASTKTRTGGGRGTSQRLYDMLTRPWFFWILPKGSGSLALCAPNRRIIWVDLLNLNLKGEEKRPLVNHLQNTHIWRSNSGIQPLIINKMVMLCVCPTVNKISL